MFEKKSYINQNGKRIASWCGTLLMSGMLIFLIFWRNWDNLWCNIDKLSIYSILAALSFYLLGGVCNAGRWWLVLREGRIGISFFKTLKITFAGAFASNFLPSTIGGDVIRYFYLFKYTKNQTKGIASLI
ncbi:MAG: flippase-like domain-containing protein, partial [Bacteroidales bacterium]|nr:flippase-like domain-containing protein [Bacteroidales bacterium]